MRRRKTLTMWGCCSAESGPSSCTFIFWRSVTSSVGTSTFEIDPEGMGFKAWFIFLKTAFGFSARWSESMDFSSSTASCVLLDRRFSVSVSRWLSQRSWVCWSRAARESVAWSRRCWRTEIFLVPSSKICVGTLKGFISVPADVWKVLEQSIPPVAFCSTSFCDLGRPFGVSKSWYF